MKQPSEIIINGVTLSEFSEKHLKWLKNLEGGEKANLSGSDLSGSDLSDSDLRGSDLSGSNLSYSNLSYSNLSGSNLSGSNLSYSNLSGSNLSGSDLSGSNLRGSNLSGSDLSGSDLRGSNLSGSNLSGSNLSGSNLSGIKIKKMSAFNGLYKYSVLSIISESNEIHIKMGCHFRALTEWENDFWNNPNEFPNDGSEKSIQRLKAFEFAKDWALRNLELIKKEEVK